MGETFGNYRIVRVRGEGGFATVYLAEDVRPAISRQVALKVLDDRFAQDPAFRDRFIRESRLAANLDHPGIAPIFDAGEIGGRFYIAMRFIDGTDLKERLAQGPLAVADCLSVLRQIASALDYAHGEGLIHRDVKPGNVLLDRGRSDRVYLADFGITKEIGDGKDFTQAGTFLGTLNYASPEQLDDRPLDGRSDQYALACLLFESLTGHPPFSGSLQTIISAHASKPPPKVSLEAGEMPPAIDAVVARGMAKSPDERYPTCGALVDAAAAALGPVTGAEDETIVAHGAARGAAPGGADPAATVITGPVPSSPPTAPADAAPPRPSPTPPPPPPPPPAAPPPGVPAPSAVPDPVATPVPAHRGSGARAALIGGAAAVIVLLLVGGALVLSNGSDSPGPVPTVPTGVTGASAPATSAPTTTAANRFTGPTEVIAPVRVAAPQQAAAGVDACGQATTYEGAQMFDGNPTTAWRTEGDGTGRRITLNLGGETLVTSVGLINGMAKVDSCDGTDRYLDQRRETAVEWTFDDGTVIAQTLDPTTRSMQRVEIETITTRVSLRIMGTTPPGTRDFTPISEIEVQGVVADT
ncbi:MAG: protein kinase [Microthrixaceae bacterium]|nr:protein kinase [Microthrixaceae bacterium]